MPRKEKAKKPKKEKPPKKRKEEKPKKEMPKITGRAILRGLPELWGIAKKGLRMTFRRIRISPMEISAVIGGEDPADTAILYGKLNAAMWTVMPELEKLINMPDPHVHLETDFNAPDTRVSGEVGLSFRIGDLLAIGFAFAGPALRWFMAFRKEKAAREKAATKEKKTPQDTKDQASASGDATT